MRADDFLAREPETPQLLVPQRDRQSDRRSTLLRVWPSPSG